MKITKKVQYALRAMFEVAHRNRQEPLSAHRIARSQGISTRFIEIILNELKTSGFVVSKRGSEGGYFLAKDPDQITVGEVIEAVQGPISIAPAEIDRSVKASHFGDAAFCKMWNDVNTAVATVFFQTTLADMVETELSQSGKAALNYMI
ncbi:MAG: Rrf2 family transcriptional regulator [Phycisphaerae bacterium]|nr:Rrf2 family transcriptional regulator [Phycisphaerae bacterium]